MIFSICMDGIGRLHFSWKRSGSVANVFPSPRPAAGLSKCSGSIAGTHASALFSMSTRGCGVLSCASTVPHPAMFDCPTSRKRWNFSFASSAESCAAAMFAKRRAHRKTGHGSYAAFRANHASTSRIKRASSWPSARPRRPSRSFCQRQARVCAAPPPLPSRGIQSRSVRESPRRA